MQTIGDRIKLLRKEKGWTQEQLAEKIEIHANSIANWEHMTHLPSLIMVMELSEVFGVTTDYILKGGKND